MLVLMRRPSETIFIGQDVKITVVKIRGNQVQIGVVAPRDMIIDREEIHVRRQRDAYERYVTVANRDRSQSLRPDSRSRNGRG